LRLAEQADNAEGRMAEGWMRSYLRLGAVQGRLGAVGDALADFRQCLHWQNQVDYDVHPLYSNRSIQHTELLTRLGRHGEAQRLTQANRQILADNFGETHQDIPQCELLLADLAAQRDIESARKRHSLALNWALVRDSKETLCWATLVKARIELTGLGTGSQESRARREQLQAAKAVLTEGLKIARDCGYGLYHIDLRLIQARLHLCQNNPQAALADLRLALDDGIAASDPPANPNSSPPTTLSAAMPGAWLRACTAALRPYCCKPLKI
jgi:tetratricopeptide (TPR) repeat protein